jgi:hypothetical protein
VVGEGARKRNVRSRSRSRVIVRSWGGMTGETQRDVKQVENGVFDLPCIIGTAFDSDDIETMCLCIHLKACRSASV